MNFLVIDFEFTQYRRPIGKPRGFFAEIIEIGAVKLCGDSFDVLGEIEDFVKPHFYPKQAFEAMEYCSITESDMKKAIDFQTMLQKIKGLYVPNETYFVSWSDEDCRVLARGCERHNMENPILPEDCLDLAAAYRFWNNDTYTTGLKNAADELGVTDDGHLHAAYDDAAKTGKILKAMLDEGWTVEHYFEEKLNRENIKI